MDITAQGSTIDLEYDLDDKYTRTNGRVYLNGSQALVRLPLMQRQRDLGMGLNTAGYISGYTGSPLGGYDIALKQASKHLEHNHIHFQPGVNEDLAATAVWGSQQTENFGKTKYDGVFGIWYGKGPGLDRSGDALKHGNYSGVGPNGGVLVLAGDDHGAKSSTTAHQSDHAFIHFGMPILNPSTVQDYLDFGIYGWAMSRYAGCWVGFKCVTDTVESSASVSVDSDRIQIIFPDDEVRTPYPGEVTTHLPPAVQAEAAVAKRQQAAKAFVKVNKLDRLVMSAPQAKLGIITSGKAYLDVREALDELGINDKNFSEYGIALYKVAMVWPLEPEGILTFSENLEEILVIEEKRPVMEEQLSRLLYDLDARPRLIGKNDEMGIPLIPAIGELSPADIAIVIAARLQKIKPYSGLAKRAQKIEEAKVTNNTRSGTDLMRLPSFCAGCPHNSSTKLPKGSVAMGGIGCHGMAVWLPDRPTLGLSQMGGEGAIWIGASEFSETNHIFQNLGDGTYYHSGLLAIRAAVASAVNITYKILVNDAIAMTGGQVIEGQVKVDELSRQVHSEGVRRIAVVSNDPEYSNQAAFAPGVTIHHRDELDEVQRELREWEGVSAIIYDQNCATELRRRRKRGKAVDPDKRTFINDLVCEGCGDCGVQSNCIAIEPSETSFGRKRRINQSACNKDFSCLSGYCPSFVTVRGGIPRKKAQDSKKLSTDIFANLPVPEIADTLQPYNIIVAGIGGSGVVTLSALLGMAAHLEGKGCSTLDIAGLAQRNGAVTSHIRIAAHPDDIHAVRIATEGANLVLGSDIVVTAGMEVLSKILTDSTVAVVNSHVSPTSAFASNPDLDMSSESMQAGIRAVTGKENVSFVNSTLLATSLLGNAVAANLFLLGFAVQRGLSPIGLEALEQAIELNGVSVDLNKEAMAWGRLAACDLSQVQGVANSSEAIEDVVIVDSKSEIEKRMEFLANYQNAAYAKKYKNFVDKVVDCEKQKVVGQSSLSETVARYYFKLLSYKDEYEVARLYTAPEFMEKLKNEFEGDLKLEFNLAPPMLGGRDTRTGRYKKRIFGSWILPMFKILARLKFLRGSALDVFGISAHRRQERQLIKNYEKTINQLLNNLNTENYNIAVEIASVPEHIRGYDTVKESHISKALDLEKNLMNKFNGADIPIEFDPKQENSVKTYSIHPGVAD
mgnify:CR=1 FL=1